MRSGSMATGGSADQAEGWSRQAEERERGLRGRGTPTSQPREVAVELELRDLRLVLLPLGALVADEPLEDVLAERLGHQLRLLHLVERLGERSRQDRDALGQALLLGELVQVGLGLG